MGLRFIGAIIAHPSRIWNNKAETASTKSGKRPVRFGEDPVGIKGAADLQKHLSDRDATSSLCEEGASCKDILSRDVLRSAVVFCD